MGFRVYRRPRGKFNCFSEYGVIGRDNRDAAKKTYRDTDSEYARARLTIMSFEEGDEAEARRLALEDVTDPTVALVLGSLAEKAGDHGAARQWYDKGWDRIHTSTILGKDNEFLPIYFCEGKAILEALEHLKKGRTRDPPSVVSALSSRARIEGASR
jgi:hypothetical protein